MPPHVSRAASRRVRVFGLDIEADFEILGASPASDGGRHEPPVRMELISGDELQRRWHPAAPRRISTHRRANGPLVSTIDADAEAGYLFDSMLGRFWLAADGSGIACAPLDETPWRWQAFLTGQVLPLAAVLRGVEVFHASAVASPRGAVAFIGASTAGKTSIALNLVLRGARFLTDDVVAMTRIAGEVVVHPGVGVANVRDSTIRLLSEEQADSLGAVLGRAAGTRRVAIERDPEEVPLRELFLVDRAEHGVELQIEPVEPVEPRELLAGSFVFVTTTAERPVNQLDICAALARSVDVFRLRIPRSVSAADVAAAISERLGLAG